MADVRQNCSLDPAVDGLAPPDSFFNPYALIQTNYSVYTYSGLLTAPPCSEIVTWNVVDTPLLISNHDFMRLTGLILDYINVETCAKGTVASPAGSTGRPLSSRNGRKITRVCNPRTAQNVPPPSSASYAWVDPRAASCTSGICLRARARTFASNCRKSRSSCRTTRRGAADGAHEIRIAFPAQTSEVSCLKEVALSP